MSYGLSRIAFDLKQHGALQVAEDITLRSVNRVIYLKVLHCLKVDTVCPNFLEPPRGYTGGFLDAERLYQAVDDPAWELSASFLNTALNKGDRCYGFMRGDEIAAYQWYSNKPTDTDWRGMQATFDSNYVYMYKGFTHPKHRGHRLYPNGVSKVLSEYLSKGYRGLLSIVESNNFASLKSCHRMGYQDVGKIRVAELFDHCLLHIDRSCSEYDLRLVNKD